MRYQRIAKKIPEVLSAEEVTKIIEAAPGPGLRYRTAFSVAYGGGLRSSEVTHLRVRDIDSAPSRDISRQCPAGQWHADPR